MREHLFHNSIRRWDDFPSGRDIRDGCSYGNAAEGERGEECCQVHIVLSGDGVKDEMSLCRSEIYLLGSCS